MADDRPAGPVTDWDWEHARHQCLRVARRRLPLDAAEDVVQETLTRGWNARHRHDGPDPVPWLVAITKNECSRYWRRSAARPAHVELQHVDTHPHPSECDRVVERVAVEKALRALSTDDRWLFQLRYCLGLSQREIATVMQLAEGTVKARLHRLREKLRPRLSTLADAVETPGRC